MKKLNLTLLILAGFGLATIRTASAETATPPYRLQLTKAKNLQVKVDTLAERNLLVKGLGGVFTLFDCKKDPDLCAAYEDLNEQELREQSLADLWDELRSVSENLQLRNGKTKAEKNEIIAMEDRQKALIKLREFIAVDWSREHLLKNPSLSPRALQDQAWVAILVRPDFVAIKKLYKK